MLRFILLLLSIALFSCGNDNESAVIGNNDNQISNADIIRNPVTVSGDVDTVNVAKIVFDEQRYEFGRVKAGEIVKKTFNFTNTGKVPLLITDARSTCGCTVADYPQHLILPGKTGEIKVEFDTKNKSGKQHKPVTLVANTYPSTTQVVMRGFVEE